MYLFIIILIIYLFQLNQTKKNIEDTTDIKRNRITKEDIQHNGQKKMTNGETIIYKTLYSKLKIE